MVVARLMAVAMITTIIIRELLHPARHHRHSPLRPRVHLQVAHNIPGNEETLALSKSTALRPGCTLQGG